MTDESNQRSAHAADTPRWFAERTERQRVDYASHFVRLAAQGEDVDGEARFIDAIAERGSRILDAGCGVGRVAAHLARCGHRAEGVDADPILVAKGRELYPALPLAVLDLSRLTRGLLTDVGLAPPYDLVVSAGNVMHFVADGSHARVVARLAAVLTPGGRAVFGFATGRAYRPEDLDRDATAAGWSLEHRFATWQCAPYGDGADWAVSVYRAGDPEPA